MKKKRTHFIVGMSILLLPVVIFYLLNIGQSQYLNLPIFGEKISPDGVTIKDTIYYQVPDFKVNNQYGEIISQKDLNDGVYIANFFFATCEDVCPSMNRRVKQIYDEMENLAYTNRKIAEEKGMDTTYSPIRFISFTVDPENDSIPVLKKYAETIGITGKHWYFVNADKEATYNIGRGFLLPVSIEDKTIDHSQQLLLIDKQNRIRGMYDALDDADMKRLIGEVKLLLYEYSDNK